MKEIIIKYIVPVFFISCTFICYKNNCFDEKNLAINLYIAGVVDNNGITYKLVEKGTSNGTVLSAMASTMTGAKQEWRGFAVYYTDADPDYNLATGKLSFPSVNNLLSLSFVPVDSSTKEQIAGPSLVFRFDLNNQMVTITMEDSVGDDRIVHSKEIVYLEPVLKLIKKAFDTGQVRTNDGTVVDPSLFAMEGGAIGLYLVITHDGLARIDGIEFNCSQPLKGRAYLYPSNCAIRGTVDINDFKSKCVKSVPYKMLKDYSAVRP
jgi:hypothetical protein